MPVYQFHCAQHGPLEVHAPITSRPATHACPDCGEPARRVFSAPALSHLAGPAASVIDRAERSADRPDVVSSVPSAPATPRAQFTSNPAHRRLPKP